MGWTSPTSDAYTTTPPSLADTGGWGYISHPESPSPLAVSPSLSATFLHFAQAQEEVPESVFFFFFLSPRVPFARSMWPCKHPRWRRGGAHLVLPCTPSTDTISVWIELDSCLYTAARLLQDKTAFHLANILPNLPLSNPSLSREESWGGGRTKIVLRLQPHLLQEGA